MAMCDGLLVDGVVKDASCVEIEKWRAVDTNTCLLKPGIAIIIGEKTSGLRES